MRINISYSLNQVKTKKRTCKFLEEEYCENRVLSKINDFIVIKVQRKKYFRECQQNKLI